MVEYPIVLSFAEEDMRNILILFALIALLFTCTLCGGSARATGVLFKTGGESYTWSRGETNVFGESAVAVQDEEGGVYRLSMIACQELLKSGERSSDNVISMGIKKSSPEWVGKNPGLIIFWREGKKNIGAVDIDIAKFGKVGELVTGKFSGAAGELPIEGSFSLKRIEDKALSGATAAASGASK